MRRYRIWAGRTIVVLAFAGLLWLLNEVGWETILNRLRMLGPSGAFLLIALGTVEALLDATALREAMLRRVNFWKILSVNQAGAILNTVAPTDMGEIFKISLLAGHPSGQATSGLLVWNVAFRLSKPAVVFAATALGFLGSPFLRSRAAPMMIVSLFGLLLYMTLTLILRKGWIVAILRRLGRLSLLRRWLGDHRIAQARELERKVGRFRSHHPRRYLAILLLQAAARSVDLAVVYLALGLLGGGFSLSLACLVFAGLQLASYLLPLLPTRIGTTEGTAYLVFSFLGLDGKLGIIFQVVLRMKQLIVGGIWILATFRAHRPSRNKPQRRF